MKTTLRYVKLAIVLLLPLSFTSCDVMLALLMAGMTPTPYPYGVGSNDYLLDPMYTAQQTSQNLGYGPGNWTNWSNITPPPSIPWTPDYSGYTPSLDGSYVGGYDASSVNSGSNNTNLNPTNHDYEAEYHRKEAVVESWYKTLTAGGTRGQDSQGNINGTTSGYMSGGLYAKNKTEMSKAQRELQQIRLEAERHGVHIQPSRWETATAGY